MTAIDRVRWIGPVRLALTAALAAGAVSAAVLHPVAAPVASSPSTTPTAAPATTLQPVTSTALSCPGPELSGISGVEDIEVPATVVAGSAPEAAIAPLAPTGGGTLTVDPMQGAPVSVSQRGETAAVVAAPGERAAVRAQDALAPGVVATQEWPVARSDLRGLATVPCAAPGSDLWLLAGGGAPGRQERLILTNAGANEVVVDLQVLGTDGEVRAPSGATVVPAEGRVALLIDAVSGTEESPAIRVRATGGSVTAVLTETWLDGSVPIGVETTTPTAPPSTHQVIPGAFVGTAAALRIAVPGQQQAVVSARLIGTDGASPLPGGGVGRVPARSTGELSLEGLGRGTYAVEVTSDVPVVAALWSTAREGSGSGDFSWAPSTTASTSGVLGATFTVGDARARTASIVASTAPATVSLTWRTGSEWTTRSLDLAADTSVSVDLGEATSVWVRRTGGAGEVRAATVTQVDLPAGDLVSVAPMAQSAITSSVSRAHPVR